MSRLGLVGGALAVLALVNGTALADESYRVRGTLTAVDEGTLTVTNDDEEKLKFVLSEDARILVVKPAKFRDIQSGQYVGVASVEANGERIALEVHIFGEDLRGTGEGTHPWDLMKEPNMMTNATVAEIKEVSAVERVLRLTYKQGEGAGQSQGEQTIRVPDFADIVFMEKAPDRSALVPGLPVVLFVKEAKPEPPAAHAVAVGLGAKPPM